MGRGYKKQKRRALRTLCAALLTGILTASMVCPAFAETARATTMKLEKIEGTVSLKTINGTSRKPTVGMRLLNGNTLETAARSYAYVSLDATKAVKVDQNSVVSLRQNGKQLELFVKSGQLFFNVSKKLGASESMNVRTSTMVTGIRGTCGVLEKVSSEKSKLYLIEGQVTLGTGQNATVVNGGQVATIVNTFKPETGEKPGAGEIQQHVIVQTMIEKAIPPVALQAIVDDPVLKNKIEKTTSLKIEKIEAALEEFKKAEAASNESEKAPSEEEQKETGQETSSDSTNSTPTDTPTGGGDVPSTPSDGGNTEEITADSQKLTGVVSLAALNAALATPQTQTVIMDSDAKLALKSGETLSIPTGKTLEVQSRIDGNETDGYTYGFSMYSGSTLAVSDGAILKISGAIGPGGKIDVGEKEGATISVGAGGQLLVNQLNLNTGSSLTNEGTLDGGNISGGTNTTITNNSLIKLWGSYTTDGSAADGYKGSENRVLILGANSSSMPKGSLLAVNSTKNMYCYANQLNATVATYMNNSANAPWTFQKDAIVPSGAEVVLSDFSANLDTDLDADLDTELDLGAHKLVVQGALTFKGNVNITGTGAPLSETATPSALIYLTGNGTLSFDYAASGIIQNKSEKTGCYVIGGDSDVLKTEGRLNWSGPNIQVVSGVTDVQYTLMDISQTTDKKINAPVYVNLNGGTLGFNSGTLTRSNSTTNPSTDSTS